MSSRSIEIPFPFIPIPTIALQRPSVSIIAEAAKQLPVLQKPFTFNSPINPFFKSLKDYPNENPNVNQEEPPKEFPMESPKESLREIPKETSNGKRKEGPLTSDDESNKIPTLTCIKCGDKLKLVMAIGKI